MSRCRSSLCRKLLSRAHKRTDNENQREKYGHLRLNPLIRIELHGLSGFGAVQADICYVQWVVPFWGHPASSDEMCPRSQ